MQDALPDALLVDLGGTHCRVGLGTRGRLVPGSVRKHSNAGFDHLETLLASYLSVYPAHITSICAGVAGPVRNGSAQLTNHRWRVDGKALARSLGADRTLLINDLQAQACALDDLSGDAIAPLLSGTPDPTGPRMVMCLGTGCNIAVAHRQGDRLFAPPSESGHTTLPDALEFRALYDHLRKAHPHLPVEAALSGAGLSRIHAVMTGKEQSPEAIIAAAPADTLGVFARLLGQVAGNLALSHMATGGVFLIGGLARAIAPHLARLGLRAPFCDHGPYTDLMARIPLHVITDDTAALLGCARYLRQTTR
ncbi:MAG: glucokinase [Pseudomonadota bacterium]